MAKNIPYSKKPNNVILQKSPCEEGGGGADSLIGPAVHYTSNSSFEMSLRCHLRIKAAELHQMSVLCILKKPFLLKFQSFHPLDRF